MKFFFTPSLTLLVLLAVTISTPAASFGVPVSESANSSALSSENVEKFTSIRSIYFDVAGSQSDPDEGMKRLSELFPPDAPGKPYLSTISSSSDCTPPSPLHSAEDKALYTSYCASFIAFAARDSVWPLKKLHLANRSLELLDAAIAAMPDSFEVRALRLAVTYHLPFFFDRGEQVNDDKLRLKKHLDLCRNGTNKEVANCRIDQRILTLLEFIG